jgi:hypothetical protein
VSAQRNSFFGRFPTGGLLNVVELRDTPDCFLGDLQSLRLENIHEFAPDMRHASHFVNLIFGK